MTQITTDPISTAGRWFTQSGDRLHLAGNHSWNGVQTIGGATLDPGSLHGNLSAAWLFEAPTWNTTGSRYAQGRGRPLNVAPVPWLAHQSAYDLTRPHRGLYGRLRAFVARQAAQGRATVVIAFEGTQPAYADSWHGHPFRSGNNHQGIRLDRPQQVHAPGPHNRYQRQHLARVIRAIAGLPALLQIGNELPATSWPWQRRMVAFAERLTDIPVGVSHTPGTSDRWMLSSGADWYGPGWHSGPIVGARVPQLLDTDHGIALRAPDLDTITGLHRAGHAILLMDGLDGRVLPNLDNLAPARDHITGLVR